MKRLLIVLFVVMNLAASCYAEMDSPATQPASPKPPDIRYLEVRVYCPTLIEEARDNYNRGLGLAKQGDLEGAVQAYRKAVDLDPNYCDAMDNLGQLNRRQGRLDEAILWYKRSIKVLPGNPVPHQNLASAYIRQGKLQEAIPEYEILIKIDPENPEGYYGLGHVYLMIDQSGPAVTHLKKAAELYAKSSSPLIMDAHHLLGLAYFNHKEYENAKYHLKACYSQLGNDPQVNYALGISYILGNRDLDEAKKYLKKSRGLGFKIPEELEKALNL